MNIRFIQTDELKGEKFAFRKLTCADIPDASGCQSILFLFQWNRSKNWQNYPWHTHLM